MGIRQAGKPRLRMVSVMATLMLIATACGEAQVVEEDDSGQPPNGDDSAQGADDEIVEIQEAPEGGLALWSRAGDVGDFTQYLADQWNEENPDHQIAVTIIPASQYMTRIATSAAAGELPDLLGADLIYMPDINAAGMMEPLTERLEELPFRDSIAQSHVDIGEWEGDFYTVPLSIDVSALAYRPSLFEEAGLDPDSPPTSLEELREYAVAIEALSDDHEGFYFSGAGGEIFYLAPAIWASGGDMLTDDEPPAANFDSPEVEGVLTWLQGMWEDGVMPQAVQGESGETMLSTFYSGDVGMVFCGSFCPRVFESEAPDLDYAFGLIPGLGGGSSSFGGGDVIGISRDATDVDLAWSFIEWILSEEVQREHYHGSGALVTRTDLDVDVDENTAVFNEAVAIAQTPRTLGYNELFNNPNSPWAETMQSAVFDSDVSGAIEEGQQRAQEIIDLAQ